MREVLVESPGTAPGSEPFITGAFIAIVPANRNRVNIGAGRGLRKVRWEVGQAAGIMEIRRMFYVWFASGARMACVMTFCDRAAGSERGGRAGEKARNFVRGRGGAPMKNARSVLRAWGAVLGADQKPDLISSNSEIIFSRNSAVVGDCMNRVPVTGSRNASFSVAASSFAMAAVFDVA